MTDIPKKIQKQTKRYIKRELGKRAADMQMKHGAGFWVITEDKRAHFIPVKDATKHIHDNAHLKKILAWVDEANMARQAVVIFEVQGASETIAGIFDLFKERPKRKKK